MNNMLWVWIGVAVVLAIIEGATLNLATIWFVIGSIFALIAAALGLNLFWQIGILLVVSIVLLIFTRPVLVEKLQVGKIKTNADSLVGETCYVTEDIDNIKSQGSVKVHSLIWTARSYDDAVTIKKGEKVVIEAIEGVKLIVKVTKE